MLQWGRIFLLQDIKRLKCPAGRFTFKLLLTIKSKNMKTNDFNSISVMELSAEEMSGIYGGGLIMDLIEILDKFYVDLKKGISDGYNLR